MRNVSHKETRRLLAELGACKKGLGRGDMVSIVKALADRGAMLSAKDVLGQMVERSMRPSLSAHNSLLASYARARRWDLGMR